MRYRHDHIYNNHNPHNTELKDNWDGIAKRVNTAATAAASKTAAECLAKFLSLPLEKEGGKGKEGASEWVRGLAAGVDGRGA